MDKEAIARIIDPKAFRTVEERLEGLPDWVKRRNANDPARQARAVEMARDDFLHDGPDRNGAIAKATAILALQSSERGDGDEEEPIPADPDKAMGWRAHKQGIGFAECRFKGARLAKWEAGHKARSEWRRSAAPLSPAEPSPESREGRGDGLVEYHGLDTSERVCFYEQDFYVLSNFSAFTLQWCGLRFDTLEAAYHWEKFPQRSERAKLIACQIINAPSAHEAFQIAQAHKEFRRSDWDDVKVGIMRQLVRAKADQHEYVRRKLLATGDRELVENSWRDDFWGWGPNRDGQNMLGKIWMETRSAIRALSAPAHD